MKKATTSKNPFLDKLVCECIQSSGFPLFTFSQIGVYAHRTDGWLNQNQVLTKINHFHWKSKPAARVCCFSVLLSGLIRRILLKFLVKLQQPNLYNYVYEYTVDVRRSLYRSVLWFLKYILYRIRLSVRSFPCTKTEIEREKRREEKRWR